MVSVHGLLLCGWRCMNWLGYRYRREGRRATEAKDEKFGGWGGVALWVVDKSVRLVIGSCHSCYYFFLYYILAHFCMEKRDRMDICDPLTHSFIIDIFIFIYYFL